jgi:hypothetical protein
VDEAIVGPAGAYALPGLPPGEGYTLLFAQAWNEGYAIDQVISWGWLGPLAVSSGATLALPDLELSLLGFGQLAPAPDAAVSAGALSPANPIAFEWTPYPQAERYWVDLSPAEGSAAWQSDLVEGTSAAFDGTLEGGAPLQPGEYWWGVGARRAAGTYTWTVYGYQQRLSVEP